MEADNRVPAAGSANELARLSATGRRAVQRNDWGTVEACTKQILKLDRSSAEGHFLAGLAEHAAGRPAKAAEAFENALEIDPARYDAAIELAHQHSMARRNADAAALLDRYTAHLTNSPRYLDMAATVYVNIGLPERAWPLYCAANALQPGVDLFQANLASCAVYLGKIDDARVLYQALLARYPAHQLNHYHLSRLETATDATHVEQMRSLLHSANLRPEKNVFLYYAIGKELEDLGRWDEAFSYYEMAGNAVTRVADYDIDVDLTLIDKVIAVCDASWLTEAASAISDDADVKTPIFIVGLPRTGTTLVERILSSHSQIQSLGETRFLQMVLRRESGIAGIEAMSPTMLEAAAKKDISLIAEGYLEAVRYRLGDEPMFIDKLPFNILYLGFVAKAFPDGRMILLDRHPMDACFAMYKQVFTWAYKFSYALENLARYYVAYDRLRTHWRELLGPRLIEVQYETLVADQERQTRTLLERLGLAFEETCLAFEENRSASTTASSVQVREKIHGRSVGRWRHFEKHLRPLQQQLERAGIAVE